MEHTGKTAIVEGELSLLLRKALASQYHAALAMLRQVIQQCPHDLWAQGNPPFWQVAYHTAFFTHIYLQPNEAAFRPWKHHREEYQFLGSVPWPPHRAPRIGEPYTQSQVLDYVIQCEAMVDSAIDALDLAARDAGFWWYKMSKVEHQIMNVRHIQHHTTHLIARVRAATGETIEWIAPMPSPPPPPPSA
jgi:hypothetical protein